MRQEIEQLKNENRNQTIEIAVLKERIESQDEKIDQKINKELDKRMKEIIVDHLHSSSAGKYRQKWPYRLIPAYKTIKELGNGNITNPQPTPFYGPPANCSDLSRLGYPLNGFYQVSPYTINGNSNDIKVETVFCAFKQPEGTFKSSKVEKRVMGQYLKFSDDSINGTSIHFHVEMISGPTNQRFDKDLQFNIIHSSMGSDIKNLIAGFFIAPKSGLYHFVFRANFAFSSKSDPLLSSTLISLHLNYEVVEKALWTSNRNDVIDYTRGITTTQATLKLDKGKIVHLKWNSKAPGSKIKLGDYSFKGYLLKEIV